MTPQSHQYTQTHHGPTTFGPSSNSFGTVSIHIFQTPYFPQFAFFPIVQQTSMEILNYPIKGSFLFSTAAHIAYFCTACILTCMLAPQIYLACKHKKLHTLVTAMTLQRPPPLDRQCLPLRYHKMKKPN